MLFFICVSICFYNYYTTQAVSVADNSANDIAANDVAEELINLLGNEDKNESTRVKELREKLSKIDSYVINRDKYAQRLLNETKPNHLNETNFYQALVEQDHFRWRNDTKNLYLKLKEKMNRDDLLKILAKRGEQKISKSARRMMGNSYLAKKRREKDIDEVVDKYLGEVPRDEHKFDDNDRYSQYWDPQAELEERLKKKSGRRIFKGERTTVRYFPFVVSIHIMGRFWCGGAIYYNDLVITSASCLQLVHNNRFFRENPRVLSVRIGSNHSRIGGELVEALEVYFHPAFNPRTLKNNIAMIRLRLQMKINHHRIPKMIEISTQGLGVPFTAKVLLLGWGVTKINQKMEFEPIFLQSKELPVYPNKFCQEVYGKKFITHTMFCAGTVTTGEGACDHDAGGPAVLNGKLVGIISFGPSVCGFPDAPTVFTLVGAYTDWIETVNETMPGYYRGRKRSTTTTMDPFLKFFRSATRPTGFMMGGGIASHDIDDLTKRPEAVNYKKMKPKLFMMGGGIASYDIDDKTKRTVAVNYKKMKPKGFMMGGGIASHDIDDLTKRTVAVNYKKMTTEKQVPKGSFYKKDCKIKC